MDRGYGIERKEVDGVMYSHLWWMEDGEIKHHWVKLNGG